MTNWKGEESSSGCSVSLSSLLRAEQQLPSGRTCCLTLPGCCEGSILFVTVCQHMSDMLSFIRGAQHEVCVCVSGEGVCTCVTLYVYLNAIDFPYISAAHPHACSLERWPVNSPWCRRELLFVLRASQSLRHSNAPSWPLTPTVSRLWLLKALSECWVTRWMVWAWHGPALLWKSGTKRGKHSM